MLQFCLRHGTEKGRLRSATIDALQRADDGSVLILKRKLAEASTVGDMGGNERVK